LWGRLGQWFNGRWQEVAKIFGNTGQWFHDRFTEAYNAVTGAFGNIGGWFTDRWHDIQGAFGSVGQWFKDAFMLAIGAVYLSFIAIGSWFNDRWHEITVAFAPVGQWFKNAFMLAIGAVYLSFIAIGSWFHDRWNEIAVAFAPVGQYFHDRFTEAWNNVVIAFTPIGQWFNDRWQDVIRIFSVVAGWFHDRFTEAWNHIVAVFTPIGKWFQDRWNDVMGGINTFKTSVINKFNEIKTGVTNIFHDMINGIVDKLNQGIASIEGFINSFGRGLNAIADNLGTKGTVPMVHLDRVPRYASGINAHPGGPAIVGDGPGSRPRPELAMVGGNPLLLGVNGPMMIDLPRGSSIMPHEQTNKLLKKMPSLSNIPAYEGGIGDIAGNIMNWVAGGAKGVLDNLISTMGIKMPDLPKMENIASGMFNKVKDWALGFIEKILPKFDFGGSDVSGALKDWIAKAMAITKVPADWGGPLATIAQKESGGNPNAQNNWDSNAAAGIPSKGLFQTIEPTFRAYALPGYDKDIFEPISNSIAAIRYILSRYGDVWHVPGIAAMAAGKPYIGYSDGGVINEPISGIGLKTGVKYAFGEKGPETIIPGRGYVPSGVNLASNRGSIGNQTIIHVHNYIDGKEMTDVIGSRLVKSSRSIGPIRSVK
jgi:hypothetical protein